MVAGLGEFAFENFPGAGAFFAEDQALGEEIRDGDLLSGEGVVCGADAEIRFLAEQEKVIALLVKKPFQDNKIEFAVFQFCEKMGRVVDKKVKLLVRFCKKAAEYNRRWILSRRCGAESLIFREDAREAFLRCSAEKKHTAREGRLPASSAAAEPGT